MPQISYNGAFSSATGIVADVYLNILPPQGGVVRPATVGVLAMLGVASWGPVNVPTQIGNAVGLALFGTQKVQKYDLPTHAFNAQQIQVSRNAGASIIASRVTDGTDTAASGSLGLSVTGTPTVTAGGTGYVTNDKITLANGVVLTASTVTSGAVTAVTVFSAGATSQPANPVAQASTTGVGTGATFTLAYIKQLTITSIYTGSAGNGASATLAVGSAANSSKITISMPGFANEVFDNIVGTANALWIAAAAAINNGNSVQRGPSQLVIATAGTATTAAVAGTTVLTGGTDGTATITSSVLIGTDGTTRTGIYAFRGMGCSHGVVCDLDDHTQNTTLAAFAQSEGIYWGYQGPMGEAPTTAATAKSTDGTDTPWLKVYLGDWIYANDNVNGGQRLLGPATFGMAVLSTLQPQESGLNKQVPLVVATQRSKSGNAYATNTDLVTLTNAGIEVICNPIPAGNQFGNRIGQNASSNASNNTDNWPVLTSFLARSLAGPGALGPLIGQLITPDFFTDGYAVLDNFLAGLKGATPLPVVQDYQIKFDRSNNPQVQTATGQVTANVLIQYLGIAARFLVNMQTGATVVIPVATGAAA